MTSTMSTWRSNQLSYNPICGLFRAVTPSTLYRIAQLGRGVKGENKVFLIFFVLAVKYAQIAQFFRLCGLRTATLGWHIKSPDATRSRSSSSAGCSYRAVKASTGAMGQSALALVR